MQKKVSNEPHPLLARRAQGAEKVSNEPHPLPARRAQGAGEGVNEPSPPREQGIRRWRGGLRSVESADNHGGDVGRISSYSELSSAPPNRAGISTKSSFISSRQKILRNLVMNRPASRWPASCESCFWSSAGASRTK